ncbi:MAG: hypothetical protein ACRDYU_17465 [Actinomycetes bacterium]
MSERGLVVHHSSLEAIEAALTTTHDEILSTVRSTMEQVDAELIGWSAETASRAAQMAHQQRLEAGVERLCDALTEVRTALEQIRSDAHDTEVRNVAVIG